LLSEKQGGYYIIRSGNGLRSGHFFKDLVTEHWFKGLIS